MAPAIESRLSLNLTRGCVETITEAIKRRENKDMDSAAKPWLWYPSDRWTQDGSLCMSLLWNMNEIRYVRIHP